MAIVSACLSLLPSPVSGNPLTEPVFQSSPHPAQEPAGQSRGDGGQPAADVATRFYYLEKQIARNFDRDAFTDERDVRGEYVALLVRVFGDRDWHTVTQRLYHASVERVCGLTPEQQSSIGKARKSWRDGTRLKGSRNYPGALASYEEASRIYRELLGAKDVWTIAARVQIAQIQQVSHKFTKAKTTLEEVVPLVKSLYGDNDPCYADVLQSLGAANLSLGDYDQAESQLRSSLEIQQVANGVESYPASIGHYHLACLYNERRQFPKAEAEAKIVSRIVARMLPDKYMENVLALWQLGKSHLGQEEYAETAVALARAIQLIDTFGVSPPDPMCVEILDAYATALQKLKRDKEAAEYRSRADALRAKQHQNRAPEKMPAKKPHSEIPGGSSAATGDGKEKEAGKR